MKWTKDQQKVIDLRNRNILVSAAAGSGKTAVLVERIIQMVTDATHPVDIDRLLIVTFTNAAAAEMRERIGLAIEKKLMEQPSNEHLQKQMTLIHTAQITTIHSFCLNVIRNHFNSLDLDPSFRIGDEAELTLMMSDVIEALLEEEYETANEDFLDFVEWYSNSKSDAPIEELILQLYRFSMSYPWPEQWLKEQAEVFDVASVDEMEQMKFMSVLLDYIRTIVHDLKENVEEAVRIAESVDGPYTYLDALHQDIELFEQLEQLQTFEQYDAVLNNIKFATLSRKKAEGVSPDKKQRVMDIRNSYKKAIQKIAKDYFFQSEEAMLKDINTCAPVMKTLVYLTLKFMEAYAKVKEEKVLVDFNDLEHMALKILVEQDQDGNTKPSSVAKELSEFYEEIMIDEYQDSNLVQETILTSVSREQIGKPNVFMVGDVKQSIYKFRLARPELFMEKYETYTTEDSLYQKIDLHKNFRSRGLVLDMINFICEQIMTKKLGNIEYDADAALYEGAQFPDTEETVSKDSELILVTLANDEEEEEKAPVLKDSFDTLNEYKEEDEEEEYSKLELEAKAVAMRIKELVNESSGLHICTKQGEYRQAQYRDIVILLRTMANWADIFVDTLLAEGIPAHADTATGYFKTLEIKTILNLLRVIDNPLQDIPFAAVLHSPIGGLESEELALLRTFAPNEMLYQLCNKYLLYGEQETLKEKLKKFLDLLNEFREMQEYLSIHELIIKILERTHFYEYVSAMPAGNVRKANIDMLVQKAVDFESTSYSGLFQFIRYMDRLHKYEVDFGEASVSNENDNTVRIMSIHKSKGLEFPIVFVSGMGKNFNNQDSRNKVVIHPDLGLGPDVIDLNLRVKSPTIIKKVIQRLQVMENLGEELRVLYVALTRAKEKLIMTGFVPDAKKVFEKYASIYEQTEKELSFFKLTSARSFLDYVIPAMMRHEHVYRTFLKLFSEDDQINMDIEKKEPPCTLCIVTADTFLAREKEEHLNTMSEKLTYEHWDANKIYDQKLRDKIHSMLEYTYAYQKEVELHAKVTVSELKRLSQLEDDQESYHLYEDDPMAGQMTVMTGEAEEQNNTSEPKKQHAELYVPKFARMTETMSGAGRGTLYHKVLEVLDLSDTSTAAQIKQDMETMIEKEILPKETKIQVNPIEIYEFAKSNIAKRMMLAKARGQLYKEQQFVIGVNANQINQAFLSDEIMLVQGVIDAYFEEEDGLVLVDYKTDSVFSKNEQELIDKYRVQLDYYKRALEQITKKCVKEQIIYSFSFKNEIKL